MVTKEKQAQAIDWREIFNPRPVGERVNPHVTEAVVDPSPDYDAMRRFLENPDYSKLFSR